MHGRFGLALALAASAACGGDRPHTPPSEAASGATSTAADASEAAAPFDWADIRWGLGDVRVWCEVEHRFVAEVPEPTAEIVVESARIVLGERELPATDEGLGWLHDELKQLLSRAPRRKMPEFWSLDGEGRAARRDSSGHDSAPEWSSAVALRIRALPDARWTTLVRVVCLTASGALRVLRLELVLEGEPELRLGLELRGEGYGGPNEAFEVLVGEDGGGRRAWLLGTLRTQERELAVERLDRLLDRWSANACAIEAPPGVSVGELHPFLALFLDGRSDRFTFRGACSPDLVAFLRARRSRDWSWPLAQDNRR